MKKHILLSVIALMGATSALFAQDLVQGVPANVFYLMPEMGQGTILYKDKSPARGTFNICALDNSVRFMDKYRGEMILDEDESLVEVIIDNVPFLRRDGVFYRLDKLSDDVFLATKREVLLMTDTKMASYGMESNTTAVDQVDFITGDGGVIYHLSDLKEIPYRMTETSGLYRKGAILPLTKKNCIKCFPDKKAEIEAWFAANKKMDPGDYKAVMTIMKSWVE
jgi:hypothetical protein